MRSHTQRVKTGVLPLNEKKDNNSPAQQTGNKNNVGVYVFCSGVLRITVVLDLQLRGLQSCLRSSFTNNYISECPSIWIQHCLQEKKAQSGQGTAQELLLLTSSLSFPTATPLICPRSQAHHVIKKMDVKMTGG